MNLEIYKPRKAVVPLATGMAWRNDGRTLYQVKEDGCFGLQICDCRLPIEKQTILAGERLRDGSFVAFDAVQSGGVDVRSWPLIERWEILQSEISNQQSEIPIRLVESSPNGARLLTAVLNHGGEGVVAKAWDAPYGEMHACKRVESYQCVITRTGGTQSVEIADACTMAPRGHVALRGGKCDRVRVGTIIKVEGLGLTVAGRIREPRPCKDTSQSWLVRF